MTRTDRGFTLIEVMIALVILAIGLLGLQALAIGSAKMTTRASVQSEYTSRAGTALETIISRIQDTATVGAITSPYSSSTYLTSAAGRNVAVMRESATKTGNIWAVTISVLPSGHPVLATRDSIRLTADVFDPN